ncbi:MAG: VWA domain-containing protein [Pseudomonadota bacterium]
MSRITRFAARDAGPAARVAGFLDHARANGMRLGVAETETALMALTLVRAVEPEEARRALKAVCVGCAEDAARFDALFDAYWCNGGRVVTRSTPAPRAPTPAMRSSQTGEEADLSGQGAPDAPDDGADDGDAAGDGAGKLIATRVENLMRRDLRNCVSKADVAEAERVAERLGAALRDRRSRRRRAAKRGAQIDFRRLVRQSLSTGGEPIHLPRRARPARPAKIVALADVSGSMTAYARPFLAFLMGLMRNDSAADAYIFHTRLVRIASALRDPDSLRALGRLTLLADGFGGGSKIGGALAEFARAYAPGFVDGRTVVLILSDGYDSAGNDEIGPALARLRKRGCRIVWLNPLKAWDGYAPVARGMAAALPHLDALLPADTLAALAALDREFARL